MIRFGSSFTWASHWERSLTNPPPGFGSGRRWHHTPSPRVSCPSPICQMTGHIEGIHSLEGFRQTPSLLMVDVIGVHAHPDEGQPCRRLSELNRIPRRSARRSRRIRLRKPHPLRGKLLQVGRFMVIASGQESPGTISTDVPFHPWSSTSTTTKFRRPSGESEVESEPHPARPKTEAIIAGRRQRFIRRISMVSRVPSNRYRSPGVRCASFGQLGAM